MQRILDFLRHDDLPRMTRPNYVAELRQIVLWGVLVGTVEGSTVAIVASKTFHASRLLTTVIWALPVLINVVNLAWGSALRGRPRKPAFLGLIACGAVAVAAVGLTDSDWRPWGGWVFAAQVALIHLFVTGLLTLRTTMWRVNYPATHRGRIAGRLQTVRVLAAVLASGALSLLYNYQPRAYRVTYPVVGAVALCSLWPARQVRMRGERGELRRFREHVARVAPTERGWYPGVPASLREAAAILTTDPQFARYMLGMFLLGSANFFTEPILVNALTKDLDFDYFSAQVLLYVLPQFVLLASIRRWAGFFDRVGVLRFRIHNSAWWASSYAAVLAALSIVGFGGAELALVAWPILVLARCCNGLGHGGGVLAWEIGHLHFAREHQTELYMGIHVGLTGLRGLLMPLAGLAAREVFGYGAIAIPVLLAIAAHLVFRRLTAAEGGCRAAEERTPKPPLMGF